MWFKSFLLGELSFANMPSSCYCMKMNENSVLELFAKISSLQPVTAMRCGDPTWMAQNFVFLEMSNFNIYVVHSAFGAILDDTKFGSFHVGSPHGCHWPHLTNSGHQFQQWTLFIFKQ